MKLRSTKFYIAVIILITSKVFAANTNPVVTNVTFGFSGTTVTVHYDVADAEQTTVTISMEVSSDNGTTWEYNYGTATGDIGTGISVGPTATSKTITWIYTGGSNPNCKIRIFANDETVDGSPCPGTETVTYSEKTYNTIQIGDQCWLKENLDVGIMITTSSVDDSMKDNGIIEKYCYDNDPANCTTYGGLYQWDEAMQYVKTEGAKGICPTGWHIPDTTDMNTLSSAVLEHGNALKQIGQGTGLGVGTNTSGFSILIAGYHHADFGYFDLSLSSDFWSSSAFDALNAKYFFLYSSDNLINPDHNAKVFGYSVRCIKD